MEQTFETFIQQERDRLAKAREEAHDRRRQAEEEIAAIDRELNAIQAYENAKRGMPAKSKTHAPRSGRRGKREEVLNLVKGHPDGMTRRQVLEALNATDKGAEQSASNALSALKRQGQLRLEGGIYKAT